MRRVPWSFWLAAGALAFGLGLVMTDHILGSKVFM